jgi:osmotically-inducible protein OsmY
VRLSGVVPTYTARRAAQQDAWSVAGVVSVENLLDVKYTTGVSLPTDIELKSNVENILRWESSVDTSNIDVTVNSGVVSLEGTVLSYWELRQIEDLVLSVTGTIGLENKLAVVPTENVVDENIAEDIIGAISRNHNVDVDDINVKVKDGKVTLSGTVPNWAAASSAYESALYTGGVKEIENNIVIEPL